MAPQRCPCPNPRNLWIYLTAKRTLQIKLRDRSLDSSGGRNWIKWALKAENFFWWRQRGQRRPQRDSRQEKDSSCYCCLWDRVQCKNQREVAKSWAWLPSLAASKEVGTSVLQLQGTDFYQPEQLQMDSSQSLPIRFLTCKIQSTIKSQTHDDFGTVR